MLEIARLFRCFQVHANNPFTNSCGLISRDGFLQVAFDPSPRPALHRLPHPDRWRIECCALAARRSIAWPKSLSYRKTPSNNHVTGDAKATFLAEPAQME